MSLQLEESPMWPGGRVMTATVLTFGRAKKRWASFGQDRMGPAMAKLGFFTQPDATFFPLGEAFAPREVKVLG
jgi:hypothetical protein